MEENVSCRCNQVYAKSLCCFANDDWFCPRCGERLSEIWSYNHVGTGSAREIWLYPISHDASDPNQVAYELKIYLGQPGVDRRFEFATPSVEAVRCPPEWKVTLVSTNSDASARLLITRQTPGRGGSLETVLPIWLTGNFPETNIQLRLCCEPKLEWSLFGKGIEPRRDGELASSEGPAWRFISDAASMPPDSALEISLTSQNAPIAVKREINDGDMKCVIDGRFISTEILSRPPVGFVVDETHPAKWQVKINFREFKRDGQILRLELHQDFVGRKKAPLELTLEYRPTPVIVEPERTLTIGELFWGETCSNHWDNAEENPHFEFWGATIPQVLVRNTGETVIELRTPFVKKNLNPEIPGWLELNWMPGHAVKDGIARLEPGETIPILVRVKLPAIPPVLLAQELTSGLAADVWIQNVAQTDYSPYRIHVSHVRPRQPCPHPLVIDFGNSSSLAAVMNSGLPSVFQRRKESILHVHGGGAQQSMPSVIAIRQLNLEHPLLSDFEIGNAAYGQPFTNGTSTPRINVLSNLKRWMAYSGPAAQRRIGDDTLTVPSATLVRMFLYGLIRRAEAALRCYSIARIAVSYPAKFRPHARRRLQSLINDLCQEIGTL